MVSLGGLNARSEGSWLIGPGCSFSKFRPFFLHTSVPALVIQVLAEMPMNSIICRFLHQQPDTIAALHILAFLDAKGRKGQASGASVVPMQGRMARRSSVVCSNIPLCVRSLGCCKLTAEFEVTWGRLLSAGRNQFHLFK